jgi:acetyltransferase-like isoleucine patch superfamily enzyme
MIIDIGKGGRIKAGAYEVGVGVRFGRNFQASVTESLIIGDRCVFGDDCVINGRCIEIGNDLFNDGGLNIGGGDCDSPEARLHIGDRCTIHNSTINIARPVFIGNDVGLSPHVDILTHGFWLSVLEGFPAKFAPVIIDDGVIVGWRSVILPGVTIGRQAVIGAQSVVTKDCSPMSVYAGNPARPIRDIGMPDPEDAETKLASILEDYRNGVCPYHGISPKLDYEWPVIQVNACSFNCLTMEFHGKEDAETDDFRDYMRRFGIRFYSDRPFRSALQW